jgi:HAD superfamily hydrolase (TIGR01490 family)
MAARPFAVFDIDGTIIRWQLYHALGDELARMGHLDPIQFQKVREARMNWKQRQHQASFQDYERTLVNLVDAAIATIRVEDLQTACRTVLAEYKDQVYTYTRDLIRDLKTKNYLLFAISASQAEIVQMLAEYYGFDDYGGSIYGVKDGYFSGQKTILKAERKPEYLKELVSKHDADWQGSIGVGDSESDIAMLSAVETPLAFNPTRELFDHAKANNWKIIVERKNMIYELEPSNGSYLLAQAGG